MSRPGHHQAKAEFLQPAPAGLGANLDPPTVAYEAGHLEPTPQAAVGRLLSQAVVHLGLLRRRQLAGTVVVATAVDQPFGAIGVPAFQDGAGVDIGKPYQWSGLLTTERLVAAAKQPDQVPAGLLLGVGAVTVTATHLLRREGGDYRQSFHAGIFSWMGFLHGSRSPQLGIRSGGDVAE